MKEKSPLSFYWRELKLGRNSWVDSNAVNNTQYDFDNNRYMTIQKGCRASALDIFEDRIEAIVNQKQTSVYSTRKTISGQNKCDELQKNAHKFNFCVNGKPDNDFSDCDRNEQDAMEKINRVWISFGTSFYLRRAIVC